MITVGVTGLPFSGKTSFMKLVARQGGLRHVEGKIVVKVPDSRLERLAQIYSPQKVTPVEMEFIEAGSVDPMDEKNTTRTLANLQETKCVLIILKAFESESVPSIEGYESPAEQLKFALDEFRRRDISVLRGRIERLEGAKRKLTNIEEIELKILKETLAKIEGGENLKLEDLKEDERKILSGFALMNLKPKVVVANTSEGGAYPERDEVLKIVESEGMEYEEMPIGIMAELLELDEEEREVFMEEYGVKDISVEPLMRKVMSAADMIVFYTTTGKEIRAWELKKGSSVVEAAGTIHTDMARGFIRAEVFKFEDIDREGSEKALKEKGLIKVVGRDYVVEDGDVIYIRFNV